MAGTHAALAVRGNAIYLFYVTDRNPSGTLSAISSQPPSSSSSTSNTASPIASSGPFIPASASSFSEQNYGQDDIDGQVLAAEPAIAPTAPNSGDGNNLYMQPQAISPNSVAPGGGQVTRLSMVSTSSLGASTSTYRHDLLLAYNSGTQLPLLFRLTPKSPGTGNGLQSSSPPGSPQWSFDLSPSQPLAPASYLCLATGISGGRPIDSENEGTTVYQLVAAGPTFVPQFRIIDVYDSGRPTVAPGPGLPFISIQPNLNPVVVRLKNNDQVDTVVIGVSATSPLATAIQINSDLLQLSSLMSVPGRFDATACYTDGKPTAIATTTCNSARDKRVPPIAQTKKHNTFSFKGPTISPKNEPPPPTTHTLTPLSFLVLLNRQRTTYQGNPTIHPVTLSH
ncbi:MAG: hypothetical protein J3R72DRAFT_34394 [Linnemannia gamsii]|nr:MAG: hypothetical protein J3R72DRAFT_34394 [Linnemannia gamsii]